MATGTIKGFVIPDDIYAIGGRPFIQGSGITSTADQTITFTGQARIGLYIIGTSAASCAFLLVYGTATSVSVADVYKGANISYTTNTNVLTLKHSQTSSATPTLVFLGTSSAYNRITIS